MYCFRARMLSELMLPLPVPILACSGYNASAACPRRKAKNPYLISMHTFKFFSEGGDASSGGFDISVTSCFVYVLELSKSVIIEHRYSINF